MGTNEVIGVGDLRFALLLHSIPSLGDKSIYRLLQLRSQGRFRWESLAPEDFETLRTELEIAPKAAGMLAGNWESLITKSAELARLARKLDTDVTTAQSAMYPPRLQEFCDAPPPVLYSRGRLELVASSARSPRTFAVVASNGAGAAELAKLDAVATDLSAAGGVVVTGHDRAPYQRAALGAQRVGGATVFVFDRGLREALGPMLHQAPFAAARIRDAELRADRDLAISPFRLDDHGLGANNRRRDELIFALADVVIAIDVRAGGEMVANCLRAMRLGRAVYVADGGRDGNDRLRAAGCPAIPTGADRVDTILSA